MAGGGGNTPWERVQFLESLSEEQLCCAIELTAEMQPAWWDELQVVPDISSMDPSEIVVEMCGIVRDNGWMLDEFNKLTSMELELLIKGNEWEKGVSIPNLRLLAKQSLIDFILSSEETYGVSVSAH